MADIEMPITHDYKSQANVRVEFYDSSKGEFGGTAANVAKKKYWELFGFLTDTGLELTLENRFKNALDFGVLDAAKDMIAGVKGLAGAITGNEGHGYITGGPGNKNIILNAPYFWQGTEPIRVNLPVYQIADVENDIMINYQRIMEILSPGMGVASGEAESITIAGGGPGIVYVHYFPQNGEGQGRIIFGPCLCERISMKVAPPYNSQYMPIIGEYSFNLLVSRIVDRTQIKYIFNNNNDVPENPYTKK